MFLSRPRAAVLGAVVVSLALTACAPPGQPAAAGVAASYEGTDVTNARVDDIYESWLNGTKGQDVANRRQILTVEVLREDLLAKCEELGYPVQWSTAEQYADQWIQFKGQQGEADDNMIEATQGILALWIVAYTDPTFANLREVSDNVEASIVASHRSGAYSTDALIDSVQLAMQTAENKQLGGQFSYTEFQNASAFVDEDRPWFDRGTSS